MWLSILQKWVATTKTIKLQETLMTLRKYRRPNDDSDVQKELDLQDLNQATLIIETEDSEYKTNL